MSDDRIQALHVLWKGAPRKLAEIQRELSELQAQQAVCQALAETLQCLRVSWKAGDPGKNGTHWFFAKDYVHGSGGALEVPPSCVQVWARGFIDDEAGALACGRKVVGLDQVDRRPCPSCGKEGYLVGSYEQTFDSPSGDEWSFDLWLLCLDCPARPRLEHFASDHRFM
jgi:hypothetical protein